MSNLVAKVSKISSNQNLNIVEFDFLDTTLKMMSLDLPKGISIGKSVELLIKPTNVIIAKGVLGEISLSNRIFATIQSLENGELLSSMKLKIGSYYLESIITKSSSQKMNLKKGDEILALIKASDLSILRVLND
ncbi:TOBE domain-containing protein [Arcobacter vandammei]|uniref:TOBE domain-containing protein n=1 Tax=Arcobacter vandammei TaxID=2782243 RepID=UPI0018DFC538|nr:TOBE domain-containing protein [Arcobacter vandammei]